MISFEEARRIVLENVRLLEPEETDLIKALGLVSAEDVIAEETVPPFNSAAMDGFAVRSSDTQNATPERPVSLEVVEDKPAGVVSKRVVLAGQAIMIMTGASIPKGADAVIKVEDTALIAGKESLSLIDEAGKATKKFVKIFHPVKRGENIRLAGEDIKKGEMIIKKGTPLRPAHLGLLASVGKAKVKVFSKAKVAIITTGDELVEVGESLSSGKIRNSNAYTLLSQVLEAGAEPFYLGIAKDLKKDITAKIKKGLEIADVILTTGGVSVGAYDIVKEVLGELKADLKFWKVAQRPGKPLAFWVFKDKLIFGLPGYPVASMVCFEEYVRPALRKMMGHLKLFRPEVDAILEKDLKKKSGRLHFVRVRLRKEKGSYFASPIELEGSGILKSMAWADALALVPANVSLLKAGEKVKIHLIGLPEDH